MSNDNEQCNKETTVVNIAANTAPANTRDVSLGSRLQAAGSYDNTAAGGYMSSLVAQRTGCGSYDSPWKLVAPLGLRLKFFLLDFGQKDRKVATPRPQDWQAHRQHQPSGLPICQVTFAFYFCFKMLCSIVTE